MLRCAALQAYVRLQGDPETLRARLVEALLDPDPDLRADAMEALADLATVHDLPAIRRSLRGDPVREVKQAAIRALGRIGEARDKAMLRDLVLSRCDDRIAWEDTLGDWEEWLDVQISAIEALGQLGDAESIETLFEAHDDPHGQNLNTPVFDALGKMGPTGVSWLLAVVKTGDGLTRKRAADALAALAPDLLIDHLDTLLDEDDPALRHHAVKVLAATDKRLWVLATEDEDADVRRAALRRAAPGQPGMAFQCLKDNNAEVQADALDLLTPPADPQEAEALAENICLWTTMGKPALLSAAARNLGRFAPDRAEELLAALAQEAGKPLDARVTAARALANMSPPAPTELFLSLLSNPAQQVRLAAVLALRDRPGDKAAQKALADAVTFSLLGEDEAVLSYDPGSQARDAAAPKDGNTTATHVRITPDGDIVDADAPLTAGASTLSSILTDAAGTPQTAELAEDTPEESAPKRKKRRAVEGPDEIARSLALDVLRSCADVAGAQMSEGILHHLTAPDTALRATAWVAASVRAREDACARALFADTAHETLQDTDPMIQFRAFEILDFGHDSEAIRSQALAASDTLTRAEAVHRLPASEAICHLVDASKRVRDAALDTLLREPTEDLILQAVEVLGAGKHADTLSSLLSRSDVARDRVLSDLGTGALNDQQAYVLLRALAGAKT